VVNSDETGHRTNAEKRWLWVMVAQTYVVYMIAASRKAEVLVALLGKVFNGIIGSDRCPSYAKYHKGKLQYCWAHFKRNILGALGTGQDNRSRAVLPRCSRFARALVPALAPIPWK
jgi:hypothetical protein